MVVVWLVVLFGFCSLLVCRFGWCWLSWLVLMILCVCWLLVSVRGCLFWI